jgi:hypothetical protein
MIFYYFGLYPSPISLQAVSYTKYAEFSSRFSIRYSQISRSLYVAIKVKAWLIPWNLKSVSPIFLLQLSDR